MIWEEINNDWNQVSDKIRRTWGKLSDEDLTVIAGDHDRLLSLIQKRYGCERSQAEKMVDEFTQGLNLKRQSPNAIGAVP